MDDENRHSCGYCVHWIYGLIKRGDDIAEKKLVPRRCQVRTKTVKSNSDACRYFAPTDSFFCDQHSEQVGPLVCMNRRLNRKKLKKFNFCAKCWQFDVSIEPIIEDYYLNNRKILDPEKKLKGRVIKRRPGQPKKRKIKRRKESPKRIIKRRKPKRIIKRRKS